MENGKTRTWTYLTPILTTLSSLMLLDSCCKGSRHTPEIHIATLLFWRSLFYPTLCFIVVGANSCSQQLVCDSSAIVSSNPFFCLSFFFLFFRLSRVVWFSLTFSTPCWSPDGAFFQHLLVISVVEAEDVSERPSLSSHCVHDIFLGSGVSWVHGGWLKGKGGSALMQIYWWVISLAKYCNSGAWQEMCKLHAWHCGFSTHSHLQWPLEGTARLLFALLSFGFSCAWWQVATASWTNCIW